MNTANWIPDLFYEKGQGQCRTGPCLHPSEAPDLQRHIYGQAFEKRY